MEKIIALQNCMILENSISGGDVIFPKMFLHLKKKYEVHVIGNKLTKSVWAMYDASPSFHLYQDIFLGISQHLIFGPFTYLIRAIQSTYILLHLLRKFEKNAIIYSSSDYFPDIIPAFIAKFYYPHTIWIGRIYHLTPSPWNRQNPFLYSVFSFLSQRLSILLMRAKVNKIFVLEDTFADIKEYFPSSLLQSALIGTYRRKRGSKKIIFDAVSIGTITQYRGVFDLLPIWKNVVEELPNAKLAIVGGGSSVNIIKLKKEIQRNHLAKNISYFGMLSEDHLLSIISKSKLHLSTRIEGGASLPALEAASFGIPTVAYKTRVFNGIGRFGHLLVQQKDFPAFAKSILSLLRNNQQYKKLSNEARKNALHVSWGKITEDLIKTLNQLTRI